jgi:NAD(P)-dependent dehydrogenase (short-subunit alcohol dehydrogenase family)
MLQELFGLTGRVALVTGAGRGIGREVAIGFAGAGADVALASRTAGELEEVATIIRGFGRRALCLPADMSDVSALPTLVDRTVEVLGRIDILVNNAGIALRDPVAEARLEDFDYMVNVNLKSILVLSQTAIKYMKAQGAGKIINVTSLCAELADIGSGVYGMTKGGLKLLTKAFGVELARDGVNIQVNCIGPGAFATSQWKEIMKHEPHHEPLLLAKIPAGRVGDPREIVGAFIYLASAASSYITGQTIYVDGGWLSS